MCICIDTHTVHKQKLIRIHIYITHRTMKPYVYIYTQIYIYVNKYTNSNMHKYTYMDMSTYFDSLCMQNRINQYTY